MSYNVFEDPETIEHTTSKTASHCEAEVDISGVKIRCGAIHQSENEEHRSTQYDSKTGYAVKVTWQ